METISPPIIEERNWFNSLIKLYIKKMVLLFVIIFFPWVIVWKWYKEKKHSGRMLFLMRELNLSKKDTSLNLSKVSLDNISGMLNWPELLNRIEMQNGFSELVYLISIMNNNNEIDQPSDCWQLLATKNCNQLLDYGYKNFKRTLAHNYFNFLVQKGDIQIKTVEQLLTLEQIDQCQDKAKKVPLDVNFKVNDSFSYYYFLFLLGEYVKQIDKNKILKLLKEPAEGNPITVEYQGINLNQDLANSIIEYYSIEEVCSFKKVKTVLEIGGGYGRNAYVIKSLNPTVKIILVDILPALYIAQRYLSSVFAGRKIFRARQFNSYHEVQNEMNDSEIVFLLPHQLQLLPEKTIDLTMNISSFGEMTVKQIEWYFEQINRITKGYFYTKQWYVSKNPFDNLYLKKEDYLTPTHWEELYSRSCVVQNEFFESMYLIK